MKTYFGKAVSVCLMTLALATLGWGAHARAAEKASLRLSWILQANFAPFFYGLDKGFYKAEGIDLTIHEGRGSSLSAKLVAQKKDTFGITDVGVAIKAGKSVEELRQLLIDEEYSRVPVYDGSIDRIDGFVHTRDTLDLEEDERQSMKVRDLMRPIGLVPETKPINELLRAMQDSNTQLSIVVDEYGQTAGLVTMEDLMEEIVGEIRDESEPASDVVKHADHSFVVSGNLDVDRLEELVGYRPDEEFESTTLGGLVCEQLGRVPVPGTRVTLDAILIEVLAADERRVSSARVRRLPSETEPAATAAESTGESEQGEGEQ